VLDDLELARRRRALACHASQLTDRFASRVLAPLDLEPLSWPAEHYVDAARR
jgi:hypothetical protein